MKLYRLLRVLIIACPILVLSACGGEDEQKKTPNSEMNGVAPTGEEESRAAMGVGEGNQDERGEYPKNQANLHPDSTRKDTIRQ